MGDDYSFLQEKIKDEAGSPKTLKKKIIRMILLGLILGVVACCTFFALKPLMEGVVGQDKQEVSIPEDEEIENAQEEQKEEELKEQKEEELEYLQMKLLKSMQNVVKDISPALVTVSGKNSLSEDAEVRKTSGIMIADNGSEVLVLGQTLWNKEINTLKIVFADGSTVPAELKKQDNNIGLGIYAIQKDEISQETLRQIENIKLGNSFLSKTGDPIIILGVPSEEEFQVSYGFIASSKEKTDIVDGNISLLRADMAGAEFDNGMMFNQKGELIGIINKASDENEMLVTVYSISDIKKEIECLSNGKSVPYLGIWGMELPEELKAEGLEQGVWVEEVDTESPAMEAGIQCGDVITEINDVPVPGVADYRKLLLNTTEKNVVTLTGFRKGADNAYVEMDFKVVVGKK